MNKFSKSFIVFSLFLALAFAGVSTSVSAQDDNARKSNQSSQNDDRGYGDDRGEYDRGYGEKPCKKIKNEKARKACEKAVKEAEEKARAEREKQRKLIEAQIQKIKDELKKLQESLKNLFPRGR
jgi:septin family protein